MGGWKIYKVGGGISTELNGEAKIRGGCLCKWSELGGICEGVVLGGVLEVLEQVLDGSLAGHDGLHEEAEACEHSLRRRCVEREEG